MKDWINPELYEIEQSGMHESEQISCVALDFRDVKDQVLHRRMFESI